MDNNLKVIVDKIAKHHIIENKTHKTDKKSIIMLNIWYFKTIKTFWNVGYMKSNRKIKIIS